VDETSFPNAKSRRAVLIAYKASADLAGKASLFLITILAARRLSPQSFGTFALGSTLGWMVAVVSDCGIQLHLARAVARQPAQAAQLLRGWLRVRVWMAAGAIAVVVAGLTIGWRTTSALPIAILAVVYTCSGLIELLHYFYRGLSRSDVESSLTLWQRGGTLVCGVSALVWRPDVTLLAIAMLLPVVVTLAASARIAARLASGRPAALANGALRRADHGLHDISGNSNGSGGIGNSADLRVCRDRPSRICSWPVFRRDVWPIGAGIVLSALYFRIDVFLVQLWSGTEAVALYNAVFRLVEALRLFPAAVLAVALPSLARAGELRPLARIAVPITAFAIAATAVLWVLAGWLIPALYGAAYAPAVPAFRILLLSFPLLSLNYALTHQLVGWDGQRVYAALCGMALAVNVLVNARLIPSWSIEGAAWATLATEAALTAGCAAALWSLRSAAHPVAVATEA
jgi:O-antigen/teichoic acid export membrane protein